MKTDSLVQLVPQNVGPNSPRRGTGQRAHHATASRMRSPARGTAAEKCGAEATVIPRPAGMRCAVLALALGRVALLMLALGRVALLVLALRRVRRRPAVVAVALLRWALAVLLLVLGRGVAAVALLRRVW